MESKVFYEIVDTEYGMMIDSFSEEEMTEDDVCKYTQELVNHEKEECSFSLYRVTREKVANGDWNYADEELIGCFYN